MGPAIFKKPNQLSPRYASVSSMNGKYKRKLQAIESESFNDGRRDYIYKFHLERDEWGETPKERLDAAHYRLSVRLKQIKERDDWLWGIGLVIALTISVLLSALPGELGLFGIMVMWFLGYQQGKYKHLASCEVAAFESQLTKWESDGQPVVKMKS